MLFENYPELIDVETDIKSALKLLIETYESGGKLMCCGNGGSCADCDHIVGELMKGFMRKRNVGDDFCERLRSISCAESEFICENLQGALPAISLSAHTAVLTAFSNDVNADTVYAQMVYGYGNKSDVLLCVSTSGNSKNVVYAAYTAKAMGIKTIALTGKTGGSLLDICDVTINVPETETYRVQELHLPVYHYLCSETEKHFFD